MGRVGGWGGTISLAWGGGGVWVGGGGGVELLLFL